MRWVTGLVRARAVRPTDVHVLGGAERGDVAIEDLLNRLL